jgi:hypothetical protein
MVRHLVGHHVELKRQPLGVILDGLWKPRLAPGLPKSLEGPVIDVNRDLLLIVGVDTNEADDGAKVDDALDPNAQGLHETSTVAGQETSATAMGMRRSKDALRGGVKSQAVDR